MAFAIARLSSAYLASGPSLGTEHAVPFNCIPAEKNIYTRLKDATEMPHSRIHTTTQSTGRSSISNLPARMSSTVLTQRRSTIPTRTRTRNTNAPSTIAESIPISPLVEDTVRRHNHSGPASSLTTFRGMQGAGVSGGVFLNTTGPVHQSVYNVTEGAPSMQPLDDGRNIAEGTGGNIHSPPVFTNMPTAHPAHTLSSSDYSPTTSTPRPSQNAEYDIYYHHLLGKGRGTPLWEPGPQMMLPTEYRRNGVSIGDVGILYRTGDFAPLFNIFLHAEHEINRGRVPNGFIPLDKSKVERAIKKSIVHDRGSCLASSSLRQTDSSDFAFQTTGRDGAVLVMPDGALSEDLRSYKLVEKYIADNAKSWYDYVTSDDCGMQTENGDIRVVVGMDKVSCWGMATFENVNVEEPLRFEFKDDGRASHCRSYKWDRIIAGRAGPPEEEIRDLLEGPNTPPLRNQCVFVRTLNISISGKVRDELAVHEIRASCFREDYISGSKQHEALYGQRNANFQTPQAFQPVSHPSKLLNKYLLEMCPNAEVVITKDSDWISVITEDDTTTPSFEDICSRVLASHIICEKEGVVTLKRRKGGCNTGSMSDMSPITIVADPQTTFEDVLPTVDDDVIGRLFLKTPDDPKPPDTRSSGTSMVCSDQSWLNEKGCYYRSPESESPLDWLVTHLNILKARCDILIALCREIHLLLDLTKGPDGLPGCSLCLHRADAVGRGDSENPTNTRTRSYYRSPLVEDSNGIPSDPSPFSDYILVHHAPYPSRAFFNAPHNHLSCLSSDCLRRVFASSDNTVRLWDVGCTGKPSTHSSSDYPPVVFAPDGMYTASNHDRTIRIWNVRTSQSITTVKAHGTTSSENPIGFIQGGYGSYDRVLRDWDIDAIRFLERSRDMRGVENLWTMTERETCGQQSPSKLLPDCGPDANQIILGRQPFAKGLLASNCSSRGHDAGQPKHALIPPPLTACPPQV